MVGVTMTNNLNDSLSDLDKVLTEVILNVRSIQESHQRLVYKSDAEAAEKTGFGRDRWERIRMLVPHIRVPAKEEGKSDSIVYPIDGVREWLRDHQEFY